ncbi:uncharacterized protein MELLADRAFT_113458 [Melampsora larici-populina 98AG31]|uniref:Sm domain-containing protein n=1 Tax=Melampsora larici-populina (strain 98AG31 / pathotype 3-4-7) TaxID=747676 RepID=F4S9X6_MELLP|nr:uncharacterized protein MELLADRAFT_113458 [Melampsora larici-populina 98AG31]EGF98554.1 hypothetical protein MELLADRAFT_113458 [Melampsora larici-populina 98AG31]
MNLILALFLIDFESLNLLTFFQNVFKTLTGQEVTIELKNDLAIQGTLASVDQFLNLKLENIKVLDQERYPHMMAVKNCFIRGSVVRYVQIPKNAVDTQLLEDATRKVLQLQMRISLDEEGKKQFALGIKLMETFEWTADNKKYKMDYAEAFNNVDEEVNMD